MTTHLDALMRRRPELGPCRPDIEAAFEMLRASLAIGGKLLLCGNGGSAADAEHWAGEMLKSFKRPRPLPETLRNRLPPAMAERLQAALPAIPLTGFLSAATAFANDVDAELVYAQFTLALGRPGDVMVGLSTSGNSRNVLHAFEAARAMDMRTLALTGADGGLMKSRADTTIRVPERETANIQELHLPVYHCLCLMLEDAFFAQ